MKRLTASLVAAAAVLGSTLAGTALGQETNAQGALEAPQMFNAQQGWGDQGYGWGSDRGRFARTNLEGRWVADDRAADFRSDRGDSRSYRGDFRGRGPMRDVLLPDLIRIDQRPNMVRIADSRNRSLRLIMLGGKFDSRTGDRPDYLLGRWRGSMLIVNRAMPRGTTITQTFALENRGRTLVVKTRREGFGPRTVEITSTYHRA